MSDQEIINARAAFSAALPEVEYRAGTPNAPVARRGRRAGALAAVSGAAAVTLFAVTSATTSAPAWSATPSTLNSAETATIDQQCRAARTDFLVVTGTGGSGGEMPPQVSGDAGDVAVGGGAVPAGGGSTSVGEGGTVPGTASVGDLPLVLIDSRGSMALALYGDSAHHVVCTVDPAMGTTITPDTGAWPKPTAPSLLSASAGMAMGSTTVGTGSAPATTTLQIVGMIDPSVRAMTVEVPNVGTVTATVKDAYYSLFIPNSLLTTDASTWTATLTLNDGTTRTEPVQRPVADGMVLNGSTELGASVSGTTP